MTPEQQAAYVIAQAACANAMIAAMQATNQACAAQGLAPVHTAADFVAVPDNYGLHHNSVLTLFHGY